MKMRSAEGKSAPLGVLHFDTDISGLSLQVHKLIKMTIFGISDHSLSVIISCFWVDIYCF